MTVDDMVGELNQVKSAVVHVQTILEDVNFRKAIWTASEKAREKNVNAYKGLVKKSGSFTAAIDGVKLILDDLRDFGFDLES